MLRFATILLLGLSVPLGAAMAQNTPAAKEQDVNDFKLEKPTQAPTGPSDPTPSVQPDVKPPVKSPAQVVVQPSAPPATEQKTEQPKTVTPSKKAAETKTGTKAESKSAPEKAPNKTSAAPATVPVTAPQASDTPVAATPTIDGTTGTTVTPGADTILDDIAPAPGTGSATTIPAPAPQSGSDRLVPGLIGAAVVGILGVLMWLWSRRRRAVADSFDEEIIEREVELADEAAPAPFVPEIAPITPNVTQVAMPEPQPDPQPEPEAKSEPEPEVNGEIVNALPATFTSVAPIAKPEPITNIASTASDIKLAFVPERVVISFNSLSLYGDLEVYNSGSKPAHNVKLYTGLITANADQHAEISAFHAGNAGVDPDDLDNMTAGEKIALSLSLVLPLSEIQSYALGTQQLTVPIMLARVSHESEPAGKGKSKSAEHVQTLSCIIGREAVPPQPKMGPLRLDMGPRSYASLGQRAIAA